jgi:hypothetical protein
VGFGAAAPPALAQTAPASRVPAPASRVAASLVRVFGQGVHAETLLVDTSLVLRAVRGDSLVGFALVRNGRGKDQPITFLVAMDPADRVADVDVLVYREPYGGEVAYESWRRQFRGRGAGDSLRVGREIRGIAGATISVNAVTLGVRRAVADLVAWRRSGAIR